MSVKPRARRCRDAATANGLLPGAEVGIVAFAARLPSDPAWGLGAEFSRVLGPVWRIVVASIAAELAAELVDTEVYHWWVTKITAGHQWARVLASNAVSVPLDSLIFCWGAFGGAMPAGTVWSIFAANAYTLLHVVLHPRQGAGLLNNFLKTLRHELVDPHRKRAPLLVEALG